jgi:RAQPRD family integrative conjugative element protein
MNYRPLLCAVLLAVSLVACAQAPSAPVAKSAPLIAVRTTETELEALARLEHELLALREVIRDARASGGNGRLQFDYDRLTLDLDTIRLGIRKYRAGELDQPRAIEGLSGEYRR